MEFVFECFFEETFARMGRSGLRDRYARKNVLDHLNAVIGGCSEGGNILPEEAARHAVASAIQYHQLKKHGNHEVNPSDNVDAVRTQQMLNKVKIYENICLMGKFHNILYIALRTCWDYGVRDSELVVQLLEEIYSCEKTFERLFLGALFGPNAPHFIAGWRSDFNDQEENTKAVVYFLDHATWLNFQLPYVLNNYGDERILKFVDIPIESCGKSSPLRVALQATCPDILMILLRYGADPMPDDGGSSTVLSLLDKLVDCDRKYVCQMVVCLHILLKNVPLIEMPFKPYLYEDRKERFKEKYGSLLVDRIIKKEQVFGVMSLKHLCRCRIREVLRKNSQLPIGIDTLRLPLKLQRYIDLTEELDKY